MTPWTPVTRVVGACLLHARESRMMLPEEPAELLGITPKRYWPWRKADSKSAPAPLPTSPASTGARPTNRACCACWRSGPSGTA